MTRDWRPQTQAVRVLAYDTERTTFLHSGAWWVICPECRGRRVFWLPDGSDMPCVYCKTKGIVPVAMEGEL